MRCLWKFVGSLGRSYTRSRASSSTECWNRTCPSSRSITSAYNHVPLRDCRRWTRAIKRNANRSRHYATSAELLPRVLINDLRSQEVVIEFVDDGRAIRYPSFWLRENCPCSTCTHPHTKQRQVDTFQLDPDVKATSATPTQSGLEVTWSDSDHSSIYPWPWLLRHEPFTAKPRVKHQRSDWQHLDPASPKLPTVDFEAVMKTDTGLSTFLSQIRTYGLSFITDTPPTPEASRELLERIAFIRVTHWGGFYDFTSNPNPTDTAYTNLSLPAHTDTTYFTDPCGLQLFHVLEPATGGGGESTFVDGFAAAAHLHKTARNHYQTLSQIPIISHASGDESAGRILNTSLAPAGYPVFTHATPHQPALHRPPNLTQIRWNNADRHSTTVWPGHQSMQTWYAAARAWTSVLASPAFELEVPLRPGTPVIFDNWRVLHGRRAFEGRRRVCGAYIGMDDFLAKGRLVDARVEAAAAAAAETTTDTDASGDGWGKEKKNGGEEDIGVRLSKTENEKLSAMGGS